jgi:C-terminal processing protease CtpA/Prc
MREYAAHAHEGIAATAASASCGWVVDLRDDTGGNMWPMLAGLKPFLGNAPLGRLASPDRLGDLWHAGDAVDIEPPTALALLESAWVAVVTGPRTASSGEMVTVAFRGRARTRSFGAPTAGLSTGNGTFPLPDGSLIFLTTSVAVDRDGHRYGGPIVPDQVAPIGRTPDGDPAVDSAAEWVRSASGCGPRLGRVSNSPL